MEKITQKISLDAALQMALYAQMERELETMPSPEELKSLSSTNNAMGRKESIRDSPKTGTQKTPKKSHSGSFAGVDYNDNRLVCGQCGIAAHNLYSGLALFAARIATNLYG